MIEQANAFISLALAGAVSAPVLILGAARNARWAACKLLAYADARDAFSARYSESHNKYAKEFHIAAPAKSASSHANAGAEVQWAGPPTLPAAEQNTAKRRAFLTVAIAAPVWIGIIVKIAQEAGK